METEKKSISDQTLRSSPIDALRTLAMIAVVFTHVVFPGTAGKVIVSLSAFAVPVFFMISGYFLQGMDTQKLLCRARKILLLTIAVTVVYLLYVIASDGIGKVLADVSLVSFGQWLILSAPACALPVHLWYLYALISCYLILALLVKLKWLDQASFLIPVIIALRIVGAIILPELGVVKLHGTLYSNAFMLGIPFMLLGHEIRKWLQRKPCVRSWVFVCLAILGLAISVVESFLMKVATVRIGSGMITSVALFVLAATSHREYSIAAQVGRKYSRDVYIWHVLIAGVLRKILSWLGLYGNTVIRQAFPVIVLLLSVGSAVLISYLSREGRKTKLQKQQEGEE